MNCFSPQKIEGTENDVPEVAGCPWRGYFNGSHYYMSSNPSSWTGANSFAISNGGHLVTISSEEENNAD